MMRGFQNTPYIRILPKSEGVMALPLLQNKSYEKTAFIFGNLQEVVIRTSFGYPLVPSSRRRKHGLKYRSKYDTQRNHNPSIRACAVSAICRSAQQQHIVAVQLQLAEYQ